MNIKDIIQYAVYTKYNTNPNVLGTMLTAVGVSNKAKDEIIKYAVRTKYNLNPNDLYTMIINGIPEESEESEESGGSENSEESEDSEDSEDSEILVYSHVTFRNDERDDSIPVTFSIYDSIALTTPKMTVSVSAAEKSKTIEVPSTWCIVCTNGSVLWAGGMTKQTVEKDGESIDVYVNIEDYSEITGTIQVA